MALSQVTSFEGLYIVSENNVKQFYHGLIDPHHKTDLQLELERLCQNHHAAIVDVIADFILKRQELSVFSFNCQSLRSHFNDLNDQVTQRANILILSETLLENEQGQSIINFHFIVKYKPPNVSGGGAAMYHNTNDRSNVVTQHMEIDIREVGSLSVNVSPVGEFCAAVCSSENGRTILIMAIYIRVNQKITDIDFIHKQLLAYTPLGSADLQ